MIQNKSQEKLLGLVTMLADTPLRLADRLVDIAFGSISASLYRTRNLQVTTILEDMVDFFTYRDFTVI